MDNQILNVILRDHVGKPSFGMEAYKLGCRDARSAVEVRLRMKFSDKDQEARRNIASLAGTLVESFDHDLFAKTKEQLEAR